MMEARGELKVTESVSKVVTPKTLSQYKLSVECESYIYIYLFINLFNVSNNVSST